MGAGPGDAYTCATADAGLGDRDQMPEVDHYHVLGLARTASADDIRAAYRKLAMRHHPDLNKGDPSATSRFQQINAAFGVLGDLAKRAAYDAELRQESARRAMRSNNPEPTSWRGPGPQREARTFSTRYAPPRPPEHSAPDPRTRQARMPRWVFLLLIPLFLRGCDSLQGMNDSADVITPSTGVCLNWETWVKTMTALESRYAWVVEEMAASETGGAPNHGAWAEAWSQKSLELVRLDPPPAAADAHEANIAYTRDSADYFANLASGTEGSVTAETVSAWRLELDAALGRANESCAQP